MNSTATKTAPEVLREGELNRILLERLRQERVEERNRRIAQIGRLWNQRKLLAKFVTCGSVVALAIACLIPSRYASTTRLMPPDPPQGQGLAALASIAGRMGASFGALGGDLLGMRTSADLFAGVLQSRTVEDELIAKFDLRNVYGRSRWVDARKELERRTDISIDRKTDIVTIRVTDHDPQRAAALAQEYVAELNRVVTQLNTSSAHRERVFLEARLGEVKADLEASEKDFSEFASKNGTFDIKEQGKAMVESAAMLEGQLIAARTELQGLRQIYTDNNVRVRAAQARVAELESQIRRIGGMNEPADGRVTSEGALYPSLRKLPLLGVTYADLYRRTKVEESVFEALTQQFEVAKVQEAKEVPSVKVLDPPDIPEKKVFPPRLLLVLTGAMLAFVIGVGWIFATDRWQNTDPQDPGKILILDMVESVKPQLEYVTNRGNSIFAWNKKILDRLEGESAPAETKE
jgi:capsule polysaccharide export protein KpsE/RkpR